ncbi:MAG: PEP/pyruvate-binding domain-containing protein [Bryobacteraceae bacterium]
MLRALAILLACAAVLPADSLIPPLDSKQAEVTRRAIAEFKANIRGPYLRIRWYCKDGSILPPQDNPCKDKGGGVQHAEMGPAARQLAAWNIHAGTILTGLPYEELLDAGHYHHRLKELVLEQYLIEVDQGWIYRKAVSYRGARQIEDEEQAGRDFLTRLLADPQWTARNYHLATQLVRVLPHGVADSTIQKARALAAVAAEQDPRFQNLRAKIHSHPGVEDLAAVQAFIKDKSPPADAVQTLQSLAALLRTQQDPARWIPRLQAIARQLKATPFPGLIAELETAFREGGRETALTRAADLTIAIRDTVTTANNGRRNLLLLDLNSMIQEKAFEMRRPPSVTSRRAMLAHWFEHVRLAAGAGLLSPRQLDAIEKEIAALTANKEMDAAAYRRSLRYLNRAVEWCRATVQRDFGPVAAHYLPAEPAAAGFTDSLVRGSAALPLANLIEVLATDADRQSGLRHSLFGQEASAGVAGLNPGIATGRFGILREGEESANVDPRSIYVIPQTASDLKPMAGILTLDSGNMLSHAQLLAANLGIPNATIPSTLLPDLEAMAGKEVFYAVTPKGVVVLKEKDALTAAERKLWAAQPAAARKRIQLDTSRLRLDDRQLRSLSNVSAADSGVVCGPKAANLGQLAGYFPDKVAAGLVVPFGIFHQHIDRDLDGSGRTLQAQITEMVGEAEKMRERNAEPAEINAYVYPRLAHFRKVIEAMPLLPAFEKEITARMDAMFGPDGSYGVFVRSDTNAEDLPEFTGAGLNLTLANQVGAKTILRALRAVWASPFTERAHDWRSRALIGTDKVYPSVIVMRAVPSDKSGVIATADLETGDPETITVNLSEGVSAVVDGGVAESILISPDGGVRLLQQCRATYRKTLGAKGGFLNLPPLGGDTLLDSAEIAQLRAMVADVKRKYPPARAANGAVLPWDIEFGFEKGALRLFQIRPLVRFQELATLAALASLESPNASVRVSLDATP